MHTILAMTVEKLEVDPQTVQHGVEGLMYLITECSKLMVQYTCVGPHVPSSSTGVCFPLWQVSEIDFLDSVMVLGFSEELNQHLLKVSDFGRMQPTKSKVA